MSKHDWSRFCKRVTIKANIQEIYDAWAKQENLERWFLRKAEFTAPDGKVRARTEYVQKGDAYEWLWYGYGDDAVERRKVLEANGKDRFQFTSTGDCIVTVTIKTEEGENIAELWQGNIVFDENPERNLHLQCSTGWTFYLANLKSVLEGGLDLRNKNVKILNVVNA